MSQHRGGGGGGGGGATVNVLIQRKAHYAYVIPAMTGRQACADNKMFPCLSQGSNPVPLTPEASALTTRYH